MTNQPLEITDLSMSVDGLTYTVFNLLSREDDEVVLKALLEAQEALLKAKKSLDSLF